MSGSGLFSGQKAVIPHSMPREVEDLRNDVKAVFAPMAAISVEEWTNPAADDAAGLKAATAASLAVQVYTASQLIAGGIAALLAFARNVTFTTAGNTPADAPATATVVGTDVNGAAQTEVVNVAQTATIAVGVKAFKTITSITYSAGQGTDCTVAIGFGSTFGLPKTPKARAGLTKAVMEIAIGAVVVTGTINATNKTYTPAAVANGTNDYAVFYEYVAA